MKTLIFAASVMVLASLSSCSGGYTCPTYMQDNTLNKTEVLVNVEEVVVSEKI